MLSISFILSFIMAAIAMIIGILAFNAFIGGIPCPTTPEGLQACEQGKSIGWTVVAIFPVTLFFGLTALFSKLGIGND
jgi:hypothetical protein